MRSPAKSSGPPRAARSSAGSAMTLLCRSEATVRRGSVGPSGGAVGGRGDEPRDADELLVDLVVERARGRAERLERAQRGRHLGAVGVVLRAVDVRARRQQHDERDADRERGRRPPSRSSRAARGPVAAARRERDEQAEQRAPPAPRRRSPGAGRRRARRVACSRTLRDVERAGLGERRRRRRGRSTRTSTLTRAGSADDREAHAPVDERDVEVERALVQRVDGQAHAADVEVAVAADRSPAPCPRRAIVARITSDDDEDAGHARRLDGPSGHRRRGGAEGCGVSPARSSGAQASPARSSAAQASPARSSGAQASPARSSGAQASPARSSAAQASPARSSGAQASPARPSGRRPRPPDPPGVGRARPTLRA